MGEHDLILADPARPSADERRVARGFWPKLRRVLGRIPFTEELLTAYFCATDAATPAYVKAVLLAALAYFVVPLDMVPDFLAVIGFGDDASVLLVALQTVRAHIRPAHRAAARRRLAELRGGI